MLRTWREHLFRYRGRLALALLFMAGLAAAEVGFVSVTRSVFASFENLEDGQSVASLGLGTVWIWAPLLIIALATAQAGFFYLQALTAQGVGVSVLKDLQSRMYGAILDYDLQQLKGRGDEAGRIGGLVSRFTNDMTVLRDSLRRIPNAVRDLVRVIAFVGTLIVIDPVLFGCILLVYPVMAVPITVIGKAIRRVARRVQGQVGDVTGLLTESLAGQELIKSYTLEEVERRRMDVAFEDRRSLLMKLVRLRALNEPIITVISSIAIGFIIGVATFRIDRGLLAGSDLTAFLVAMALLSQPLRGLSTLNAVLQEGLAAIERVFGVIDDDHQIDDEPHAEPFAVAAGKAPAVSFDDVHFAYDPSTPLLEGFALSVPAGSTVALVGPSGAGKSTVFGLLPRFYEASHGRVLVDGRAIRSMPIADLRRVISVVSQTPVLFDISVEDNIRLGRPDADDNSVRAAAEAAAADGFIQKLPEGYKTRVGEAGGSLSGGERQRISLARAFLKDAPILLLDEATSALDAESERLIEDAMKRLRRGRTTLIIAHRLSTIRDADTIAVMEAGRLVEAGSHDELLAAGGLYAKLVALQDRQVSTE